MRNRYDERGFIKVFLTIVIVVCIVFVGISFGKPYYRYNTLRSYTKDVLASEIGNLDMIKGKVLEEAKELNIPLEEKNVEVTKVNEKIIKVRATWSEVVDFWGYYTKQLDFVLEQEY